METAILGSCLGLAVIGMIGLAWRLDQVEARLKSLEAEREWKPEREEI